MNKHLAICILSLLMFFSHSTLAGEAKEYAMDAYHLMEESPFDSQVFKKALSLLESATKADSTEPWIYIASSLAVMQRGYKTGSWYSSKTFGSGVVDKALELAERAHQLGESESQAHAHLARIFIVKKEYEKARELLNKAYSLDNDSFYPWFYKAIIGSLMEDYTRTLEHLDEAEKRTNHRYQNKLVTRQRQKIAKKTGDKKLEESLYKKNISDFPDNAYMYGNYASFLYRNKRYKEAAKYYEKAIQIKPYPNALKWLKKAKEKSEPK